MKKLIVVGLDFDGVVAYNPVRIFRPTIAFVKKQFFGITKTHFWVPQTATQKIIWSGIFRSSVFPASGAKLLRHLVTDGTIEAHLVTGRFSFMKDHLFQWLSHWGMRDLFSSISVNTLNTQPHLFKERVIRQKKFDYYIEDNLDIVEYLIGKTTTKILWIYNIFDRLRPYPHKYPFLKKALEDIRR